MNTRTLLFYLREELVRARLAKDKSALNDIFITCSTVTEAAYIAQDKAVACLLIDMECAARDSLSGVEWKSEIPTDEQINAATNGAPT